MCPMERQTGRTTRLVDSYIQELFTKGKIIVRDHAPSEEAHKILFERILDRLLAEHDIFFDWVEKGEIRIDKKTFTIEVNETKIFSPNDY